MKDLNMILESLKEELLVEAADLNDASSAVKAIQRGQVPGVKAKVFFENRKMDIIETILHVTILSVKAYEVGNNLNKYLILLFNKAKTISVLNLLKPRQIEEILDGFKAYFNNINKKEARGEYREKFEEFASSPLSVESSKEFEQWANKTFAQKAKMKEGDSKLVYNKDGWEVIIPKTFAAAKEFACMNGRKARWCTAASNNYFSSYSSEDNPLYIIRNKKEDKMFQMDFGKNGRPNFKSENDSSTSIKELEKANIPVGVLKSIKNKEGKTVYSFIEKATGANLENKGSENKDGWDIYVFNNTKEFLDDIKGLEMPNFLRGMNVEDALSGNFSSSVKEVGKLTKGSKTYYYIIPIGRTINLRYSSNVTKEVGKFMLERKGNKLSYKTNAAFFTLDIPDSIKKKLITPYRSKYSNYGNTEEHLEKALIGKSSKKEMREKAFIVGSNSSKVYSSFNNIAELASIEGVHEKLVIQLKQDIMRKTDSVKDISVLFTGKEYGSDKKVWTCFLKGEDTGFSSSNAYYDSPGKANPYDLRRFLISLRNDLTKEQRIKFVNKLRDDKCAGFDEVPDSILKKAFKLKKEKEFNFYSEGGFSLHYDKEHYRLYTIEDSTGDRANYNYDRSKEEQKLLSKLEYYIAIVAFII